jgi:hypothetical protein
MKNVVNKSNGRKIRHSATINKNYFDKKAKHFDNNLVYISCNSNPTNR